MTFNEFYNAPPGEEKFQHRMVRQFTLPAPMVQDMQDWKDLNNNLYRKGIPGVRNYNMADASAKLCIDGYKILKLELVTLRAERKTRLAMAGAPVTEDKA